MIRFVERNILKECEYTFKLLVIGSECIGKTMFIRSIYQDMTYELDTYISTIGVDFNSNIYTFYDRREKDRNTHNLKVHFWDTSGQKRFYPIIQKYYNECDGVFVFFDLTNRNSYLHSLHLLEELNIRRKDEIKIFLIGTKRDIAYPTLYGKSSSSLEYSLERNTEVSDYDIQQAHKKYNFDYYEYSVYNVYTVNISKNNKLLSSNDIVKRMITSLYSIHYDKIKKRRVDSSLLSFFNSFWFYNVETDEEEETFQEEIPHNKNEGELIELKFIKQPVKSYCVLL